MLRAFEKGLTIRVIDSKEIVMYRYTNLKKYVVAIYSSILRAIDKVECFGLVNA